MEREPQPSQHEQERQDLTAQLSALQAAPAPARQAPVRPAATPSGAAALDILPSRKGGGSARRFGRRKEAPPAAAPVAQVAPMTRRDLRGLEDGGPAPASAPARPVATGPATPPAPAPAPTQGPGDPPPTPRCTPDASAAPLPVRNGSSVGASPGASQATAPVVARAVPVAEGVADVLRQRSALASEALTELSRLSTYSPAAVAAKPPATLTRRTPAATPAAEIAPARTAPANRRARNAADVRSMLSGFQAGVERGRTTTAEPSEASALVVPAQPTDAHQLNPTTDTPRPTGGQA